MLIEQNIQKMIRNFEFKKTGESKFILLLLERSIRKRIKHTHIHTFIQLTPWGILKKMRRKKIHYKKK